MTAVYIPTLFAAPVSPAEPGVTVEEVGTWASVGQISFNNTATPDTQYDLAADVVVLRNTSNETVTRHAPATVVNDITVAGPTANGRDQAGAFSASSWIHFYWIWNGTTLASLSSAVAPPTGPTFPATYTHWAYATSARLTAGTLIVRQTTQANAVYYDHELGNANIRALTNGVATAFTGVLLAAFMPPNSRRVMLSATVTETAGAAGTNFGARFRPTGSGLTPTVGIDLSNLKQVLTVAHQNDAQFEMRTSSAQGIDYLMVTAPTAGQGLDLDVVGYYVPNGGA